MHRGSHSNCNTGFYAYPKYQRRCHSRMRRPAGCTDCFRGHELHLEYRLHKHQYYCITCDNDGLYAYRKFGQL